MTRANDNEAVVFRLSSLGDVALCTGVLGYWHRTHGMTSRVITRLLYAALFRNHPAVVETIPIDEQQLAGSRWLETAWRITRRYSHHRLVDLHGTLRSAILSALWRGPVTRYPKFTAERRRYLKNRFSDAQAKLLAANVPQRYAMALDDPPPSTEHVKPKIFLTDDELQTATSLLRYRKLKQPVAILHPYAVHPAKMWPESSWKALTELLEKDGWDWAVIGSSSDHFLKEIAGKRDFTDATDLRTTCAILAQGAVLVSGDSGPVHLATAVGTPVVALFGPTSREWGFYPMGARDQVLERTLPCRPCSLHGASTCDRQGECLSSIEPDEVLAGILASSSND